MFLRSCVKTSYFAKTRLHVYTMFSFDFEKMQVNEEISLEIRHSITDWRKLTPIRVGLYAVSYPDCFVAPGM
jgi:hypothetical protein